MFSEKFYDEELESIVVVENRVGTYMLRFIGDCTKCNQVRTCRLLVECQNTTGFHLKIVTDDVHTIHMPFSLHTDILLCTYKRIYRIHIYIIQNKCTFK